MMLLWNTQTEDIVFTFTYLLHVTAVTFDLQKYFIMINNFLDQINV